MNAAARIALTLALSTAACQTLLDLEQTPNRGASEADGGDAAAVVDGAELGCPGRKLYVSLDGNDQNTGCDPSLPKRTLANAIATVTSLRAKDHVILACEGLYAERVSLDYPVSLQGGYRCGSWERNADWGPPTFADGGTVVQNAGLGGGGATLVVRGAAIDKAIAIDGLTIRASPNDVPSTAVEISEGASPLVTRCDIQGGAPEVFNPGGPLSIGIHIKPNASPVLRSNRIHGGSGRYTGVALTQTVGSVGVFVQGGGSFEDNDVNGGAGRVAIGNASIGVAILQSSGPVSAVGNRIVGGSGLVDGDGVATVGVYMESADRVDLIDNAIFGGTGGCQGSCNTDGVVALVNVGRLLLQSNRIHGGELAQASIRAFWGVALNAINQPTLVNNTIHAGNDLALSASSVIALAIHAGTYSVVGANTLYASGGAALNIQERHQNATVANNLLLIPATSTGAKLDFCAADAVSVIAGNAFVGEGQAVLLNPSACTGAQNIDDPAQVAVAVNNVDVKDNVRIKPACTAGGGGVCIPCTSPCTTSVVDASGGLTRLLQQGWPLVNDAPCALREGAFSEAPAPDSDAKGSPRTVPYSIGAYEKDDGTPCP